MYGEKTIAGMQMKLIVRIFKTRRKMIKGFTQTGKFLVVLLSILIIGLTSNAQRTAVILSRDSTVCGSTPMGLTLSPANATWPGMLPNSTTSYSVSSIPYSPVGAYSAGTAISTFTDDVYSNWIPIGFNFCFYGNVYTQLLISSNGYLTFSGTPGGGSPWSLGGAGTLPGVGLPLNSIFSSYQDLYPPSGGTITYYTTGSLPYRKFIVNFNNIPYFTTSSCPGNFFTGQFVLYETSNVIETYTLSKPSCAAWNSGLAVHGIQNSTGTVATAVTGRNNAVYSLTNDGQRFSPNGRRAWTIDWWSSHGGTFRTGDTVTSTTVTPPMGNTTYMATIHFTCPVASFYDSVHVTAVNGFTFHDSITRALKCFGDRNASAIVIVDSGAVDPIRFEWGTTVADSFASHSGLAAGNYLVYITDSTGCRETDTVRITQPPQLIATADYHMQHCFSDLSTSIFARITGGTPPYTINWNTTPVAHTDSVYGVVPGTYTVTVIDTNLCQDTGVVVASPRPRILPTITGMREVRCNGGNDGQVFIGHTSGRPPFQYSVDTSAFISSNTVGGLSVGPHYAYVRDSLGCVDSVAFTMIEPTAVQLFLDSMTPSPCVASIGVLVVHGAGGYAPYRYLWSDGRTLPRIDSVVGGRFWHVTVTDSNGCVANDSFYVGLVQPVISLDSIFNSNCYKDSSGRIYVHAIGGTPPTRYFWSTGSNDDHLVNLGPGTYMVTTSDTLGCQTHDTLQILEPSIIVNRLDSIVRPGCNGASDGEIFITTSGGTAPYSWNWSTGATTEDVGGLAVGSYILTTTDSHGCQHIDTFNVSEPAALTITLSAQRNVSCLFGNDGSLTITMSGGTAPYTYFWDNGDNSAHPVGLSAGSYTVSVYDFHNCLAVDTFTITQPTQLLSTISGTNLACHGDHDGSVTVVPSGGTPRYYYLWDDPAGQTTATATNLNGGTYHVTITDTLGCVRRDSLYINEPSSLIFNINPIVNVNCYGDSNASFRINASGGSPAYAYSIDSGATWAATFSYSGLRAGVYPVQVRDDSGCITRYNQTIIQPTPLGINRISVQNINCFGERNGRIQVVGTGGTSPYIYGWSNGINNPIADSLRIGTYIILVIDSHGCAVRDTITLIQPTLLTTSTAGVDASCHGGNNGSASTNPVGGTTPYRYLWDDAAHQTTATANALIAGTYHVTVTDSHGCVAIDSIVISEPPAITVRIDSGNITCNRGLNGYINAVGSGGTPTLTYSIDGALFFASGSFTNLPAGAYTVTIRDGNNCTTTRRVQLTEPRRIGPVVLGITNALCNGSSDGTVTLGATNGTAPFQYSMNKITFQTSNTFGGFSAGTYKTFILDSLGCIDSTVFTIEEPALTVLNLTPTMPKCFNDSTGVITCSGSGGTAPYQYSLDNGVTYTSRNVFSGLPAGTYFLAIRDSHGCQGTASITLVYPPRFVLSPTPHDLQCWDVENGTIDANPSGGTSPYSNYTFVLPGGPTLNSTTPHIGDLTSGLWTVSATDANGCIATALANVARPPVDTYGLQIDSTTCFAPMIHDGAVHVRAEANPPYTFQVDNNPVQYIPHLYQLSAGPHIIIATNVRGCVDTILVTVPQPPPLTLTVEPDTIHLPLGGAAPVHIRQENGVNVTWTWSPQDGLSCPDCPNPIVSSYYDMIYTVRVYDHRYQFSTFDCYTQAELFVFVDRHHRSYVPNAFTPGNRDGFNDIFQLYGEAVKNIRLTIFDRWGEKMYEGKGYGAGWDGTYKGTLMNPGVYVYYADVEYLDGQTEQYSGSVTLLR
jgi:gliding motility-associated-like protein